MKKLITLILAAATFASCSTESDLQINEDPSNVIANLAAQTNDQSNIGLYKGVFTTLNAKYRGTVEIRVPQQMSNSNINDYPSATLTLHDGKILDLKAQETVMAGADIVDLEFTGSKARFLFSVNADGTEPLLAEENYLGMESGIIVLKETSLGPVTPITGTWTCDVCSPFMGGGQTQTFNMISPGAGGAGALTTQTTLSSKEYAGTGSQDNCNGPFLDINRCSVSGSFDPFGNGNNVTWDGTHLYRDTGTGSLFFGNWSWQSNSNGVLSGEFITDGVVATTLGSAVFFREDFKGFSAAGFDSAPGAGQLDSDVWIAGGFNGGSGTMDFGDGRASGTDFGQGVSNGGGVTAAGIYAFDFTAPYTNRCLGVQPTASDFTEGFFEFRVAAGGLNDFYVAYDLLALNNEGRSSDIRVYYGVSTGAGATAPTYPGDYTSISTWTTTEASDGSVEINLQNSTFTQAIPAGENLHIRFVSDDVGGSGDRDELGIDNVILIGK